MTNFCLNCGANITPDKDIVRDGFTITVDGMVWYGWERINVSATEGTALHTIAAAYPRIASRDILSSRGNSSWSSIPVVIHKLKKKLIEAGAGWPITAVHGSGYVWSRNVGGA